MDGEGSHLWALGVLSIRVARGSDHCSPRCSQFIRWSALWLLAMPQSDPSIMDPAYASIDAAAQLLAAAVVS
jgi:hypothetical protein